MPSLARIKSNSIIRKVGVLFSGEVINVSGWDDRDKEGGRYKSYFPLATSYRISNYDGERGMSDAASVTDFYLDLSATLPENSIKKFDVVLNHTTLEHIFDVKTAVHNLCLISRDIVVAVLPFAQQIHSYSSFGDYWRFSPMGVRNLFFENNFEVIFEEATPLCDDCYLVFVFSCQPAKWLNKMPSWRPIDRIEHWFMDLRCWPLAKMFLINLEFVERFLKNIIKRFENFNNVCFYKHT